MTGVGAAALAALRARHSLTVDEAARLARVEAWAWRACEDGGRALPLDRYELVVWKTGDYLLDVEE